MVYLLISLILFFLFSRKEVFLWMLVPFGLFLDFWTVKPLGYSGLIILFLIFVLLLIFGGRLRSYKKFLV